MDGTKLSKKIELQLQSEVLTLKSTQKLTPGLATLQVGKDPASSVYVRRKHEACKRVGIQSYQIELPESVSQEELLNQIEQLNRDDKVHGILVQLPLPKQLDSKIVLQSISPQKDVDGFHYINIGRMVADGSGLVPCTPQGVMALLDEYHIDCAGKHAVVVGRSQIVGKPVSQLLLARHSTVTIAHSKTQNLAALCKTADILVAACGQPELVKADWVKPGATVIDVGIHRTAEGKLVGDVLFNEVSKVAGAISPVPGGVGPLTIAMLLKNTLKAAKESHG